MTRSILLTSAAGVLLSVVFQQTSAPELSGAVRPAAGLEVKDRYTLVAPHHLISHPAARSENGSIQVVVEIPAGTNAKWEVEKDSGALAWEFKNDAPRVVQYLPYPCNYGMVPRTLLAEEHGGDGDPLDVLVLGPAQPRGALVQARLIGVLKMLDGGEQDDKLIAVLADSPLANANSVSELRAQFPGAATILETWFTNYKGAGEIESRGFAERAEAERILDAAIAAFARD